MEKKHGFDEAAYSKKISKKVDFFHLGKKNNWKNLLNLKMEKKILAEFLGARAAGAIVVVQGLGFVGAVTAVVCASAGRGYKVIGIDQDTTIGREKVDQFRNGILPFQKYEKKRKYINKIYSENIIPYLILLVLHY